MRRQSRLAPSFLPTTAVLEMTYRCNHRCLFCSCPWEAPGKALARQSELTPAEWKAIIRRLCEMGVCDLVFTGGEALLKEDIFEIMRFAAGCLTEHITARENSLVGNVKPPRLHLLSNGTTVTREALEFCRAHDVQLSLSLPGLATLREHTGIGDPDMILENFRLANQLGLKTVVNVTATRRNLGELYQTIATAFLAGARQLLLNRFLPGGRGLEHPELMLNATEVVRMLDVAEEALTDADRYGHVGTELPRCLVKPERYRRLAVGTRCSAAMGFFVIGPSGWIRVCNHSPVDLVPFAEVDTLNAHPYWRRFTQKDFLPKACAGCVQQGGCDGGCREAAHLLGGTLDALDPLLAS